MPLINPSHNDRATRLRPVLGLFSATAIVVGEMIGSGIFLKPAQVSQTTGGYVGLILTLWVVCGLVNLCGALSLAELAAMFPKEGGTYVFLRETYGRLWSFLWCWTEFWVIRTGAIAALAVYSALSLEQALAAAGWQLGPDRAWVQKVAAVGLITLLASVNIAGTRWGSGVQNVMTTIKVLFVVFLAVLPWLALRSEHVALEPLWPPAVDVPLVIKIGTVLAAIMWAYDGWGNVTVLAEEMHEPEKTVPRALAAGVSLVILLYFGANLAYYLVLPVEQIAREPIPAVAVAKKLLPGFGEPLVRSMLMVSLAGALNGNILVGPRVLYAMSRDHGFLAFLARLHPRTGTPVRATAAMAIWAVVLILLGDLSRDENVPLFDLLTNYCVFGGSIFYLSAVLAIFVLRVRRPDIQRPYRTWGYPVVPAIFVVFYLVFLVNLYLSQRIESSIGLAFIALGTVAYLALGDKQSPAQASNH